MKYALITILLCLFLTSCEERKQEQATHNTISTPAKTLDDLKNDKVRLENELAIVKQSIKHAEEERLATWARWVGYATIGLSFILGIAAFFLRAYPLLPRLCGYSSAILGCISFMCFAFIPFIPYLTAIGVCLFMLLIAVGCWYWWRDRSSLSSVVRGVEELKGSVPSYKEVMKRHVNGKADEWVTHLRQLRR